MSIIHDALKKVQQTNPGAAPLPPTPSQDPAQPSDPTKNQDRTNIPLLVAALCAIIAMIFAALPQVMPKKTAVPTSPAAAIQVAITSEKKQLAPKTAAAQPPSPSAGTMSKAIANAMTSPVMPAMKPQKIVDPNDPLSSIQIEGVMDMDGKRVVLISGNIYEEGQTIYGRIIEKITFDDLTVIENGQKRIFPIKP
jgi:hypothetical protein